MLVAIFPALVWAQTAGDYRSVANGNWGAAATWETYNGTSWVSAMTPPPAVPPYANVTIQYGDTVIVEASPKRAASLKVEGTAKLFANNTTNRYIRLWGNVTNDGEIGGPSDGLCYMCSTSVAFNGMGTTDIARLQVAAANVNINIYRPISLHYTGAALYGNNVDNVTYNVGMNGGVNFGPTSYVSITILSSTPSPYNATYNLSGGAFILQPGMNFNMAVRSGKRSVLNLYSGLTLGGALLAYSDSAGTEVVNIYDNGGIIFSSGFADTLRFDSLNVNSSAGFTNPCPFVVKNGLGLQDGLFNNSYTLRMDNNSTIDRGLGVLASKPVFTDTVNVIYSGATPCTTSYEMPNLSDNAIANLTTYHELYLDSTRYVNNVEAYGGPIIAGDDFTLGVLGGFGNNNGDGYVIGFMGRPVPIWGGTQQIAFVVGTANGFSPATLSITGVTKAGLIGCRAIEGVSPAAKVPQETMQRQWDIGWRPDSVADYSSASLKLYYLPEDFNTSFTEEDDESTMVMGMVGSDDSTWTFPSVTTRIVNGTNDGGMIEADEVGLFPAKFSMAKNQASLAGDVVPPTIVSTSPANGTTDVALDAPIYIVFSEPVDTLSLAGNMTPSPNEQPAWSTTMDTLYLPHDPMANNTEYKVIITALTDLAGNPLAVLPDSFMFTTLLGDTIRPCVVSVYPAWDATDVGLNDTIVIAFSEPMDKDSLDGYTNPFHDFTASWNAAGDTFTLIPQDPYPYNTMLSVIITAGKDLAGNNLAVLPDTLVKFTTMVGDTIKPHILSTSPANGAVNVALDAAIFIAFSEPMDTLSLVGDMQPGASNRVVWNPTMDTLTLPHDPFALSTTYLITLTSINDLAGNPLDLLPDSISFTTTATGVAGRPGTTGYSFFLSPASPNPVKGGAELRFGLAREGQASLEVFNVIGQKVRTLVSGNLPAGNHTARWDGCDENGRKVSSGVYVYRLNTGDRVLTRRMTVIR